MDPCKEGGVDRIAPRREGVVPHRGSVRESPTDRSFSPVTVEVIRIPREHVGEIVGMIEA
jgi:hypothetical protein